MRYSKRKPEVIDLRDRLAPYDDAHVLDISDRTMSLIASDPDTHGWAAEVRETEPVGEP